MPLAPARLKAKRLSSIAESQSKAPLSAARTIIAYSPDT